LPPPSLGVAAATVEEEEEAAVLSLRTAGFAAGDAEEAAAAVEEEAEQADAPTKSFLHTRSGAPGAQRGACAMQIEGLAVVVCGSSEAAAGASG
jgi:nucleotide-binding universal stress UspA family protein